MADSQRTPEVRFWKKVHKTDTCWLWTGAQFADGYGYFRATRSLRAHRFAWELANGEPPPADMLVCHTCDVRLCVNPAHLFIGSSRDNMRDASAKGRIRAQKITHCPQGHEYTPENTIIDSSSRQRRCRECRRQQNSAEWRRGNK